MPDAAVKKKRPLWYNLNLLDASLASQERFDAARSFVSHPLAKLVLFGLLWAFLHHLCAGIRYLFLDVHKGLDKETARKTSIAVLAVSLSLSVVLGIALLW